MLSKRLRLLKRRWREFRLDLSGQRRHTKRPLALYARFFRQYVCRYPWRAAIALGITVPIGLMDGAIAFALKPFIDTLSMQSVLAAHPSRAYTTPLMIVGFTLVQGLLNYLAQYTNGWLGAKIVWQMRRDLLKKLLYLDIGSLDVLTSGEIVQLYYRDPESLQLNVLQNLKATGIRIFSSLGLCYVLLTTSWQLALIAIGVLVFVMLPAVKMREMLKKLNTADNDAMRYALNFYTDSVGGIRVVYGYNLVAQRLRRFTEFQRQYTERGMKMIRAKATLTPASHMIAAFGVAIVIWQGSVMIANKSLTPGGFAAFLGSMMLLYNPLKNMGSSAVALQTAALVAKRIFASIDTRSKIINIVKPLPMSGFRSQLRFENVTFGYKRKQAPVLENLSFHVNAGEHVALVGPSGSGKSTIASLIPRFYNVWDGDILLDGQSNYCIALNDLRNNIGLVQQDPFLFEGTIADNLRIGRPEASDTQLWKALEQAHLADFVGQLSGQLEHAVGERGVLLSGGQRQRIAIARAFLKDAPLLILDEPTSALDNESEAAILETLDALSANRTVISIAHRLSTIRRANRILVLRHGQLVEQGSHEALLGQENSLYRTLYETQVQNPAQNPTG